MKKTCLNCGRNLQSSMRYCPECGQRSDTGRLTWHFLRECFTANLIGDDAFGDAGNNHHRGIVPTWWATLRRPGRTAEEYIVQGKRRSYFNPVAIALILAGLLAWIAYHTDFAVPPFFDYPRGSIPDGVYLYGKLFDWMRTSPANQLFFLIPFAAAVPLLLFRHKGFTYIEMLYVQLFITVATITYWIVFRATLGLLVIETISAKIFYLIQWIYFVAIFRRMTGHSYLRTGIAGLGVLVLMNLLYVLTIAVPLCILWLLPFSAAWTDALLLLIG